MEVWSESSPSPSQLAPTGAEMTALWVWTGAANSCSYTGSLCHLEYQEQRPVVEEQVFTDTCTG